MLYRGFITNFIYCGEREQVRPITIYIGHDETNENNLLAEAGYQFPHKVNKSVKFCRILKFFLASNILFIMVNMGILKVGS